MLKSLILLRIMRLEILFSYKKGIDVFTSIIWIWIWIKSKFLSHKGIILLTSPELCSIFSIVVIFTNFLFNLICNHVRYVLFNINLNLFSKKETMKTPLSFRTSLLLIMLGFLLIECEKVQIIFFICINSNCITVFNPAPMCIKIISWTIFSIMTMYIFSIALTPASCILCLMVFQLWCYSCYSYTKKVANFTNYIVK